MLRKTWLGWGHGCFWIAATILKQLESGTYLKVHQIVDGIAIFTMIAFHGLCWLIWLSRIGTRQSGEPISPDQSSWCHMMSWLDKWIINGWWMRWGCIWRKILSLLRRTCYLWHFCQSREVHGKDPRMMEAFCIWSCYPSCIHATSCFH